MVFSEVSGNYRALLPYNLVAIAIRGVLKFEILLNQNVVFLQFGLVLWILDELLMFKKNGL